MGRGGISMRVVMLRGGNGGGGPADLTNRPPPITPALLPPGGLWGEAAPGVRGTVGAQVAASGVQTGPGLPAGPGG